MKNTSMLFASLVFLGGFLLLGGAIALIGAESIWAVSNTLFVAGAVGSIAGVTGLLALAIKDKKK